MHRAQVAFRYIGFVSPENCGDYIRRIVDDELWRTYRKSDGLPFNHLAEWVAYPQPNGLGVDCQRSAEFARQLLIDLGMIGTWALIMDYISVKPGRPKNIVDDDGFRPFYRPNTSSNGFDRNVRRLNRERPDLLAQVDEGRTTVHQAAIEAGIIKNSGDAQRITKLLFDFRSLEGDAQIEILNLLWAQMDRSEQKKFLAAHQDAGTTDAP